MKNFFKPWGKNAEPEKEKKNLIDDEVSLEELAVQGKKIKKDDEKDSEFILLGDFNKNQVRKIEESDKKDDKKDDKKKSKNNPKDQKPTYVYKPIIVDKKLNIILIEDTVEVETEKEKISKIIQNYLNPENTIVIYYGEKVKGTEIVRKFQVTSLDKLEFKRNEKLEDKACFYDALKEISNIISRVYMKETGTDYRKEVISSITVVGIGTGVDNCSETPKEEAIKSFCQAINRPGIITKYFCLTEKSFLDVAEIGFRSIGSFAKNY